VFDATSSSLIKAELDKVTFDNTIRYIIDDENVRISNARLLRFYASTSRSKELREASNAATTLLNNIDVELLSRVDVLALVDIVARSIDNSPPSELDDESRYYVQKLHRAMRVNGCGISDPNTKEIFDYTNKSAKELTRPDSASRTTGKTNTVSGLHQRSWKEFRRIYWINYRKGTAKTAASSG